MAKLNFLSVQGFKSIWDLEAFPLTNMNLLIGGNGSGKSNLLELFVFLRAAMQLPLPGFRETDLKKYVLDTGVASDFLYMGNPQAKTIKLTFHFDDAAYTLELGPTKGDLLCIQSEKVFNPSSDCWYQLQSPDGFNPGLLQYKNLKAMDGIQIAASSVYQSIQNVQYYHVTATGHLSPMKSSQSVFDHAYLRSDCSNLVSLLFFLKGHPKYHTSYELIVAAVRQVAPFFDDFILEANPQDLVRLLWKQKGSDYPMKPQSLSDGTLRFICLATVLLQPKHPDTIIIDEPELGLHPYAIGLLAELMQARSTDTQLIVATQSPALISHFEPEDSIVCDRMEGQSTFTRLNSNSLDVWLEDYSLGELWTKNILSGGPEYK